MRTQIPIKSLSLVDGEQLLVQEVMEIQMMMTNLIIMMTMMYATRGTMILVEDVEDQELEVHLMEMGEGLVAEEMMEDGDQAEVRFNARIVEIKEKSMLSFFF